MSTLYKSLADVYEAMYKTFINYDEEFRKYQQLLHKCNCDAVVEIGCGTGNLARSFANDGLNYIGLDSSGDMLDIEKKILLPVIFCRVQCRILFWISQLNQPLLPEEPSVTCLPIKMYLTALLPSIKIYRYPVFCVLILLMLVNLFLYSVGK